MVSETNKQLVMICKYLDFLFIIVVSLIQFILLIMDIEGILRVGIGFLFSSVFPGYTFLSALIPFWNSKRDLIRYSLASLPISLSIITLLGLINIVINIGANSVIQGIQTLFLIFLFVGIAVVRRFNLEILNQKYVIFVFLAFGFIVSMTSFTILLLKGSGGIKGLGSNEPYTVFYILDDKQKAEDYPQDVIKDQPLNIQLGIINEEEVQSTYQFVAFVDDEIIGLLDSITLLPEEKWEGEMYLLFNYVESNQQVKIYLIREGYPSPYRTIQLTIDILPAQ